jgi:hypothetical protein
VYGAGGAGIHGGVLVLRLDVLRMDKGRETVFIKSSVRFKSINKYGVQFFAAVLKCEAVLGLPITITSANDSTHRPRNGSTSFHYEDKAWDLRINDINELEAEQRRAFLAAELGEGWDIIIEWCDLEPQNRHIHAERDTRNYPEKP